MNDGISCICANPHEPQLSSSGRPLEPSIALPPPARGHVAPLPVPPAPSALPAPLPPPTAPTHYAGAMPKWASAKVSCQQQVCSYHCSTQTTVATAGTGRLFGFRDQHLSVTGSHFTCGITFGIHYLRQACQLRHLLGLGRCRLLRPLGAFG